MATTQSLETVSMTAGESLATKQYYGVVLSSTTAGEVVLSSTTNLPCPLALQNNPASGQAAEVAIGGIAKVYSKGDGTAIAVRDRIGPDQNGKFIKISSDGWNYAGIALDASSSDGAIIRMLVTPGVMRGA